jgi:membrane protein required for beta-lactamase induction
LTDDTARTKGVDAAVRASVDSAAVEHVARHVLSPEAASRMVKNATLYAPQIAPVSGRVRGRGVPTTR